jgi:hypothetical protein
MKRIARAKHKSVDQELFCKGNVILPKKVVSLAESRMKKAKTILILTAAFAASFITVFLAISLTQSAYSTPSSYLSDIDGFAIILGPPPNATDVALDTTIFVETWRETRVDNLSLTPEVPIARRSDERVAVASGLYTFYPAEPLKPATTYNVSVFIMNKIVSWSFTTTPEPFRPGISFYLATYVFWIALATAIAGTSIVGGLVWLRRNRIEVLSQKHKTKEDVKYTHTSGLHARA